MSITTAPQHSGGIFSRLDAYRFYIMSAIGLLLLGYLYVQMTSQPAAIEEALPGVSSRSHTPADVDRAAASKPRAVNPNKIKYTGEPKEDDEWLGLHNKYKYDIETKAKGDGLNLLFYGDSITESWKGTQMGIHNTKYKGIPELFNAEYKPKKAAAYGIAGDTTSNLYWRLINGESPEPLQPKAIVVLIGTNDVTKLTIDGEIDLDSPSEGGQRVAKGVIACVQTIQEDCPDTKVVLMALLPRGDKTAEDKYKLPCKWTGTIEETNKALKAFAKKTDNVEFVDCGAPFAEDGRLNEELMPDVLHPNAAGMETLVDCLKPVLSSALGPGDRRFSRHLLSA